MTLQIRPARPADTPTILRFIHALAEYEKLRHEADLTPADVEASFFGAAPRVFCDIAELDGRPVGFAVWFYSYSTFRGRHGIYLEDLFVDEAARGHGAGKALLAGLARRCRDEGLPRLDWAVLDWNAPSIAFYDSLGAGALDGWTTRRLTGEALDRLAGRP
ncbi:MAG: GNAT family N-acetyltransferase [Caulobacter sp.]|nr:GNAT family N-acetyltransferase [Caulobacter sp.]